MPIPDPSKDIMQPQQIKLRDMPLLVISTDVRQGKVEPEIHAGISNRHFIAGNVPLEADLKMYDKNSDTIREYEVKSVVVEIRTEIEPSFEDRLLVDAMIFAETIMECGMSMEDFKQVVGLAIERHLEKSDDHDHMQDQLIRLFNALGAKK